MSAHASMSAAAIKWRSIRDQSGTKSPFKDLLKSAQLTYVNCYRRHVKEGETKQATHTLRLLNEIEDQLALLRAIETGRILPVQPLERYEYKLERGLE